MPMCWLTREKLAYLFLFSVRGGGDFWGGGYGFFYPLPFSGRLELGMHCYKAKVLAICAKPCMQVGLPLEMSFVCPA